MGLGVRSGGPAGRAGRGEVRTPPGTWGGRASEAPEGGGPQAAQLLRDGEGPAGRRQRRGNASGPPRLRGGGGEGVCKQAPPLPPYPSGLFPSPAPYAPPPSPAEWVLRRLFPRSSVQIVFFLPGGEIGKLWMQVSFYKNRSATTKNVHAKR